MVPLSVSEIQAIAPDQSSLTAAGRLLAAKHWRILHSDEQTDSIWGECQGSGANPYRVVVEEGVRGYKCTCPSRKFPCKHALALMWIRCEEPERFVAASTPQWVTEWLGRARRPARSTDTRRAGARSTDQDGAASAGRNLELARARAGDQPDASADGEHLADRERDAERRARVSARRAADTKASVTASLLELDRWIRDQLRGGLLTLADEPAERCRSIAARLVDGKATALGSRIDELPAKVLALPRPERLRVIAFELGQWVLLARAWSADPDDPDVRGAVVRAPDRAEVLDTPQAVRVPGPWQVAGVRSSTRRDGLVSRQTWLRSLAGSRPALLQDFLPPAVARQGAAFTAGQLLDGAIVYYPSRFPVRAVLADAADGTGSAAPDILPENSLEPVTAGILARHRRHLRRIPWAETTPVILPAGRIATAGKAPWWCDDDGALPVTAPIEHALWSAVSITGGLGLWDGARLTLLQVQTEYGAGYPSG